MPVSGGGVVQKSGGGGGAAQILSLILNAVGAAKDRELQSRQLGLMEKSQEDEQLRAWTTSALGQFDNQIKTNYGGLEKPWAADNPEMAKIRSFLIAGGDADLGVKLYEELRSRQPTQEEFDFAVSQMAQRGYVLKNGQPTTGPTSNLEMNRARTGSSGGATPPAVAGVQFPPAWQNFGFGATAETSGLRSDAEPLVGEPSARTRSDVGAVRAGLSTEHAVPTAPVGRNDRGPAQKYPNLEVTPEMIRRLQTNARSTYTPLGERTTEELRAITASPAPEAEIKPDDLEREIQRRTEVGQTDIVPAIPARSVGSTTELATPAAPAAKVGTQVEEPTISPEVQAQLAKISALGAEAVGAVQGVLREIQAGTPVSELPAQARRLLNEYTEAQKNTLYTLRRDLSPEKKRWLQDMGVDGNQAAARMTALASIPYGEMNAFEQSLYPEGMYNRRKEELIIRQVETGIMTDLEAVKNQRWANTLTGAGMLLDQYFKNIEMLASAEGGEDLSKLYDNLITLQKDINAMEEGMRKSVDYDPKKFSELQTKSAAQTNTAYNDTLNLRNLYLRTLGISDPSSATKVLERMRTGVSLLPGSPVGAAITSVLATLFAGKAEEKATVPTSGLSGRTPTESEVGAESAKGESYADQFLGGR
jgi:hypothetical protein